MAKNRGFNGSTITFGTEKIGWLRSANVTQGGAEVDVSAAIGADGSTVEPTSKYEAGIPDFELTVECVTAKPQVGGTTPADVTYGQKANLVVDFNDNGQITIPLAVVTAINPGGERNGELVSQLTFRACDADLT